jgi:hypothetical protein
LEDWSEFQIEAFFGLFLGRPDCPLVRIRLSGLRCAHNVAELARALKCLSSKSRIRRLRLDIQKVGKILSSSVRRKLLKALARLPLEHLSVDFHSWKDALKLLKQLEIYRNASEDGTRISQPLKRLKLKFKHLDGAEDGGLRRKYFLPDLELLSASCATVNLTVVGSANVIRTIKRDSTLYLCPRSDSEFEQYDRAGCPSRMWLMRLQDLQKLKSDRIGTRKMLLSALSDDLTSHLWTAASRTFVRLSKIVFSNLDRSDRGDWIEGLLGPALENIPSLRRVKVLLRTAREYEQLQKTVTKGVARLEYVQALINSSAMIDDEAWNLSGPWSERVERICLRVDFSKTRADKQRFVGELEKLLNRPTAPGSLSELHLSWHGVVTDELIMLAGLVRKNCWLTHLGYWGPTEFLDLVTCNKSLRTLQLGIEGTEHILTRFSESAELAFPGLSRLMLKSKNPFATVDAKKLLDAHPSLVRLDLIATWPTKHKKLRYYSSDKLFPSSALAPFGREIGKSLSSRCAAVLPASDYVQSLLSAQDCV